MLKSLDYILSILEETEPILSLTNFFRVPKIWSHDILLETLKLNPDTN